MTIDRRKIPTWQTIAMLALSAAGILVLYAFIDTRSQLEKKVDKDSFIMLRQQVEKIAASSERQEQMMLSHIMATGAGKIPITPAPSH